MSASEERQSGIAIVFCERTRRVLSIRAIVFVVMMMQPFHKRMALVDASL
jgi:hypothetical protein